MYRGAGKSLAPLTSRCILFDGENISFDVNLYIYSSNYDYKQDTRTSKSSVAVACFLPGRAKDLPASLYSVQGMKENARLNLQDVDLQTRIRLWLIQNGAPPHYLRAVLELLKNALLEQ
jgi:hypothetical protein